MLSPFQQLAVLFPSLSFFVFTRARAFARSPLSSSPRLAFFSSFSRSLWAARARPTITAAECSFLLLYTTMTVMTTTMVISISIRTNIIIVINVMPALLRTTRRSISVPVDRMLAKRPNKRGSLCREKIENYRCARRRRRKKKERKRQRKKTTQREKDNSGWGWDLLVARSESRTKKTRLIAS